MEAQRHLDRIYPHRVEVEVGLAPTRPMAAVVGLVGVQEATRQGRADADIMAVVVVDAATNLKRIITGRAGPAGSMAAAAAVQEAETRQRAGPAGSMAVAGATGFTTLGGRAVMGPIPGMYKALILLGREQADWGAHMPAAAAAGMVVRAGTPATEAAVEEEDMALTAEMAKTVAAAAAAGTEDAAEMAGSMPAAAAADMVQRGMEDVITHASFPGLPEGGRETGKTVETAYAL